MTTQRTPDDLMARIRDGNRFLITSHVSPDELQGALAEAAARAGREVAIVEAVGAGADHPVRPSFPEGRYLKGLLAVVR